MKTVTIIAPAHHRMAGQSFQAGIPEAREKISEGWEPASDADKAQFTDYADLVAAREDADDKDDSPKVKRTRRAPAKQDPPPPAE